MSGALTVLIGALMLLGILVLLLYSRVRTLMRRVGSFECAMCPVGGTAWTSGIAGYGVNRVDWHRLVSLSPRPSRSWMRGNLEVLERSARDSDRGAIVEVRCRYRGQEFHLAMVREASSGLVSWLEAAPPREEPLT